MAPRPAWKGYLKLSLVTCAVELTNATTHAEKVSFRILNRKTGNTVKRQYVDAVTGKAVKEDNQVKGYEVDGDDYLLIEEEDIEAVQIESSHTLSLDSFVKRDEIEKVYLDSPYYLTPADKVSEEAFGVIRDALDQKKMAGLARIVLFRRERPVLIEPLGSGMLLTTLRYDKTVVQPDGVFDDIKTVKLDDDMVKLATTIIDKQVEKFDPSEFEDDYENALLGLIKAKQAGKKPPKPKAEPKQPSNVVNLFDALKKSLAEEGSPSTGPDKPKSKSKAAPKRKSA